MRDRWHAVMLLPVAIFLIVGFGVPLAAILPAAFGFNQFSLEPFAQALNTPVYLQITWITVRIAAEATLFTLVLAYPLAWMISRATGWRKMVLIGAVLVPFLTSVLVRTFAWVVILGRQGPINSFLISTGIIAEPLPLLFSEGAVVLALVQVAVPMMVFPLVSTMQQIDSRVLLVSYSLGAGRLTTWRRILFPLSLPGVQSGVAITFLFCMASFFAPAMLGGRRQSMLASVIQSQVESSGNWELAAVLGIMLAVIAISLSGVWSLLIGRLTAWRRPKEIVEQPVAVPPVGDRSLLTSRAGSGRVPNSGLRRKLFDLPKLLAPIYITCMFIFLVLPLVVLVPMAFSSADTLVFPPPGLSLKWFAALVDGKAWIDAGLTSVTVAASVALITVVLATLTSIGLRKASPAVSGVFQTAIIAPMAVPSVVFALGAFLVFARVGLSDTVFGIIIAQSVLILPIVFMVVSAVLSGLDERLQQAAASLGANPLVVFWRITIPLLAPGLIAGMVLAVLMSFDESIVSIFLSDLSVKTIPRLLWEGIRFSATPEASAVSVVILAATLLLIFVGWGLLTLTTRRNRKLSLQA